MAGLSELEKILKTLICFHRFQVMFYEAEGSVRNPFFVDRLDDDYGKTLRAGIVGYVLWACGFLLRVFNPFSPPTFTMQLN